MHTPISPRRVIAAVTLLVAAAGSSIAAQADDQPVSTGHCGRTFTAATPKTVTCSFRVTAPSHTFYVGGSARPLKGSAADLWLLTSSVAGQPQPLSTCGGVSYSGCGSVVWSSDAIAKGSTVTCSVRAVGYGRFSCEAAE